MSRTRDMNCLHKSVTQAILKQRGDQKKVNVKKTTEVSFHVLNLKSVLKNQAFLGKFSQNFWMRSR